MLTKPMLLDETAQKILAAIQRIKNKLLGTSSTAVTPGSAGTSGAEPVVQDDTGRTIISALNDLGDAVPAETQYLSGVTGDIQTQLDGKVSDVQMAGASIVSGGVANIPDASATQRGLVSTGAQDFKGFKTFEGNIETRNTRLNGAQYRYGFTDFLKGASLGLQWLSWDTTGSYLTFGQYSANSDASASTGFRENFRLPRPDKNRSTHATYDILTSKNFVDVNIGAQTIGSLGYTDIRSYKPSGTVLAAWIQSIGMATPPTAVNVTSNGNYLLGTANASMTNVTIRYLVV